MNKILRRIVRICVPKKARLLIWKFIPKFYKINTYLHSQPTIKIDLREIEKIFMIKEVNISDRNRLYRASIIRSKRYYENVIKRLSSESWKALAVFDTQSGEIAYVSWIVNGRTKYFEEFGIKLKNNQFLLKDGYCIPKYRHRGLHTRMEQERINYCVNQGGNELFIQIHDSNLKGKDSVINNGFSFYRSNYVVSWPVFNIFREFFSFIKNPFIKVLT